METIEYKTGRIYNGEQNLLITVENERVDEYGMREFIASFVDSSRGIKGRVASIVFSSDSLPNIVLAEYDAGRYTNI